MRIFSRAASITFICFLFFNFLAIGVHAFRVQRLSLKEIREYVDNGLAWRHSYIKLYGGVQRILDKQSINRFALFKDQDGKLQRTSGLKKRAEIESDVDQIVPIYEYCKSKKIPFLYLTSPLPVYEKELLPYAQLDYSKENAAMLLAAIHTRGIESLDLRETHCVGEIPKSEQFYHTDHHWKAETCFAAFSDIMEYMNSQYGLRINPCYWAKENFEHIVYKDAFLGSFGINVGEWYVAKDDFGIYIPIFNTDMNFEAYNSAGELTLSKNGKWFKCLMNNSMLDNDSYYNKYNAFSNAGYVENRVVNNLIENDYKVLYISHSYGRPMTQYFSLCFKEVRNIDPQKGRFTGNYIEYIEDYQPDVVIFQCESEGKLISTQYRTGR